jgi:pimeloyl-ACP methyl ester carboxylesterase
MTNILRTSISCNHTTLSVLTAGPTDGKMILLLHGFPESAESLTEQINYLADQGYFVVAPDQRGYNESSAPDSVKDYKLDVLALDMLLLVKNFRNEKVFIVAHDWGAIVGWYLISFFPETFEKAVLASAPHWDVFRKYLLSHPKQILKSWYIFFIQIPVLPEILFSLNSYSVLSSMLKRYGYPESKLGILQNSWRERKKLPFMLNWYRAMKYLKVKLPKEKIQVPTQIVCGDEDPFCMSEMAAMSRDYCQTSEVTIMKGVGHWPQHQNMNEFNSIIKDYFIS